jgi:hypothetical protein
MQSAMLAHGKVPLNDKQSILFDFKELSTTDKVSTTECMRATGIKSSLYENQIYSPVDLLDLTIYELKVLVRKQQHLLGDFVVISLADNQNSKGTEEAKFGVLSDDANFEFKPDLLVSLHNLNEYCKYDLVPPRDR